MTHQGVRRLVICQAAPCLSAGIFSGSPAISFGSSDLQLRGLAPAQATVVQCQEQVSGGFDLGSNQSSATVLQGDGHLALFTNEGPKAAVMSGA